LKSSIFEVLQVSPESLWEKTVIVLSVTPTIYLPEIQATSQGSFVAKKSLLFVSPFSSVRE
jgi:hypothetical protein